MLTEKQTETIEKCAKLLKKAARDVRMTGDAHRSAVFVKHWKQLRALLEEDAEDRKSKKFKPGRKKATVPADDEDPFAEKA